MIWKIFNGHPQPQLDFKILFQYPIEFAKVLKFLYDTNTDMVTASGIATSVEITTEQSIVVLNLLCLHKFLERRHEKRVVDDKEDSYVFYYYTDTLRLLQYKETLK